jgi:molybdopterin converting factor small subunit
VLDEVGARWPRLGRRLRDERGELRRHVNVYIDGDDCRATGGLDSAVGPAAEVQILPSVAGGAAPQPASSPQKGTVRTGGSRAAEPNSCRR